MSLERAQRETRRLLDAEIGAADAEIRSALARAFERAGKISAANALAIAALLGNALAGAVLRARAGTRRKSDASLDREFRAAGGSPAELPDPSVGRVEDERRAAEVAKTFAEAWLSMFRGLERGDNAQVAAREALAYTVEDRVLRIAETESANAFSAERVPILRAYGKKLRAKGRPVPLKVWRVSPKSVCCDACMTLDGTEKPFDEPFVFDGKEMIPGYVHPRCRCLVLVASAAKKAKTMKLDIGPADVHHEGAAGATEDGATVLRRVPRGNIGPSTGWLYGGKCASCQLSEAHDGATGLCAKCSGSFFQSPAPGATPESAESSALTRRTPTGIPEPGSNEDPGTWVSTRTKMRTRRTLAGDLTTKARKKLAPLQFALPEKKAYPIHDPAHVKNAAARLEQAKKGGTVSPSDYRKARAAIARAARRFGIESEYNKRKSSEDELDVLPFPVPPVPGAAKPGSATHPSRLGAAPPGLGNPARPIEGPRGGDSIQGSGGLHVSVTTHPSGHRRMEIHASDRAEFGDGLPVDLVDVFAKLADAEKRAKALPEGADRAAIDEEIRKLADEAATPRWNQIAKVGRFLGHPAGPFDLSPSVFDEIIRNFREVDGARVPIDFEHASEADESAGNIPVTGAPAQGWVTDLQNRGEAGLYGLTSFLEPALSYVREGRYRSFSPAIRFGAKHPESGKPIGARLTSVALVTRPFLRGLQPLAARDGTAPPSPTGEPTTMTTKLDDKHPHEMMAHLKQVMGLHPLATHEDMKAHLDKLRDHAAKILDKPHGHAVGHISAGGVNCGDYVQPMATALNASADSTVGEIFDAVEDMIDAAVEKHEAEMHPMNDLGDAVKMGERIGKLARQVASSSEKNATLSRDNDRLTLDVKAKDAKIADLEALIAKNEESLRTLRDAETKREEETIGARVTEAFETYKDAHKLSDAHRPMMIRELKADAANFEKLYPRVAPTQRHLLRDMAASRTPGGATSSVSAGDRQPVTQPGANPGPGEMLSNTTAIDQRLLADKLVKERKMTREAATSLAYRVATGAAEMPNFAS